MRIAGPAEPCDIRQESDEFDGHPTDPASNSDDDLCCASVGGSVGIGVVVLLERGGADIRKKAAFGLDRNSGFARQNQSDLADSNTDLGIGACVLQVARKVQFRATHASLDFQMLDAGVTQ